MLNLQGDEPLIPAAVIQSLCYDARIYCGNAGEPVSAGVDIPEDLAHVSELLK